MHAGFVSSLLVVIAQSTAVVASVGSVPWLFIREGAEPGIATVVYIY